MELDLVDLGLCEEPLVFWYFPKDGVRWVLDGKPYFSFHAMEGQLYPEIRYGFPS